jgi:H+-transporting ATPase
MRDGKVQDLDAINLVPGDVIVMKFGDVVAADVKLFSDDPRNPLDRNPEELPMQVCACLEQGKGAAANYEAGPQ